jgi:hypothetical protein
MKSNDKLPKGEAKEKKLGQRITMDLSCYYAATAPWSTSSQATN